MSTPAARQPRGIPAGGQFAATAHSEPSLSLSAPSVQPEFVRDRLRHLGVLDQLTESHIHDVSVKLNESLDFTDRNIEEIAELVHFLDHAYSIEMARNAKRGLDALRNMGMSDEADALELVRTLQVTKAEHHPRHGATGTPPDGKSIPVPADDPRLQAGEVFDKVQVGDTVFTRTEALDYPNDPYAMRFQANRPLTDAEAYALSGVIGYANRSAIGGEPLDDPAIGPERDTPYSFVVNIDTTKGRQRNYEKFEEMIPDIIAHGSAPRSTKGGTRAIEAFGDEDLKLEIYYGE
ncbi:hypothetical protein [Paenarthrobacter sp. YJN-5]|uniref:hypothetical protein n=1 Tax=Paenarthrobacter sp. YJN-5 TaxID=2735316 RepID=UPI001878909E|nr:hypothetical protein [Paenarthrobacter sp. YJN-5]QOT19338.1 hypothetical protein HMI59_22030 [Paenarthrobacter sp. YJN-5]